MNDLYLYNYNKLLKSRRDGRKRRHNKTKTIAICNFKLTINIIHCEEEEADVAPARPLDDDALDEDKVEGAAGLKLVTL
jgi:hypothetical protein